MQAHTTSQILTIGDELLRGDLLDSNAHFLAGRLGQLGLPVCRMVSVGDQVDEIGGAIQAAAKTAKVLVVSGGLGPTEDDRTAEAVGALVGGELALNQDALDQMKALFERAGMPFSQNNEKQAYLPAGATALPNARGTAPGFAVDLEGCRVFCVPGVPREMKWMFETYVAPWIVERGLGHTSHQRTWKLFGLGESQAAAKLGDFTSGLPDGIQCSVHYRATFPEIHVSAIVWTAGGSAPEGILDKALQQIDGRVREAVGGSLYGTDDTSYADAMVGLLGGLNLKVAVAESCTGGLAGDLITQADGSSAVFMGGVIAYANKVKVEQLGVPETVLETHGAVSQPCVEAMARGVRERFDVDLAVAISGIAGPQGGSAEKPVGTIHFAVSHRNGEIRHLKRIFPFDRQRNKVLAAYVAWWLLYRQVTQQDSDTADLFGGRWTSKKVGR